MVSGPQDAPTLPSAPDDSLRPIHVPVCSTEIRSAPSAARSTSPATSCASPKPIGTGTRTTCVDRLSRADALSVLGKTLIATAPQQTNKQVLRMKIPYSDVLSMSLIAPPGSSYPTHFVVNARFGRIFLSRMPNFENTARTIQVTCEQGRMAPAVMMPGMVPMAAAMPAAPAQPTYMAMPTAPPAPQGGYFYPPPK